MSTSGRIGALAPACVGCDRWIRSLRRLLIPALLMALALAGCSTSTEPTTTFTGDDCSYDGPLEFDLGTEVTFTFVNSSDNSTAGYGIWKTPDGTTTADLELTLGWFPGDTEAHSESRPGFDKESVVMLDTAGTWAVTCHLVAGGPGVAGQLYPGTVFVVTDR